MNTENQIKILVVDHEGQACRRLAQFLNDRGFATQTAANGIEAKDKILNFKPRFVLSNLMLPEMNALELIHFIKNSDLLRHQAIGLIVMSGHNDEFNVRQAFNAGAQDYLVKPFELEDVFKRLVFHCRKSRHIKDIQRQEFDNIDEASLMLHLTDLVLRQALSNNSLPSILFNLTRMVSLKMDGIRCSIINVTDQETGHVVTSSDEPQATGIRLDLNKYPEVINVVNSGRLMAVENIQLDPQLAFITKNLVDINFSSMIVCPVERQGRVFGVLSLRMPPEKAEITDNEIRFVEIVGHVTSLVLSNQNFSTVTQYWKGAQ